MQDVWRRTVPRHALSSAFLMYELLAIAALHLAHLHPSHREYYYDRAAELQNSAMAGFQAIEMRVDESNCVAVLLFSSLLALQVLADPNPPADPTSTGYIDHFARCVKLMQGTRVLVMQNWWTTISSQEELLPLFRETLFAGFDSRSVPVEVARLSKITQIESLSGGACAAYEEAIDKLHWLYKACEIPRRKYTVVKWVLAWPVQLQPEYLELLDQRRPEALVILAYYGALLHFYQGSWVIRDTGKRLVTAISEQVGVCMNQWLQWPKHIVSSE
jgi:hypothetical protein